MPPTVNIRTISSSMRFIDEFLIDKRRFQIELCELGLAVGAKVLVAETPDYLEVPLISTHHEELFKKLGGLGQGIKASLDEPGWGQDNPARLPAYSLSTSVSRSR